MKKLTYEFVKKEIESVLGYKLLSKEYVGKESYLEFICPNGHKYKIRWNNWQQGQRCGKCYKSKLTYEYIKQNIENEGYTLLSPEYINSNTNLNYICSKGHHGKITWDNWRGGRRCGKCSFIDGSSKPEKEIREYVMENYNGKVIPNDRTMIQNPLTKRYIELDVWLPEINKAIEYSADYYHKEKNDRTQEDKYKQEWCKNNGIDLLVINHSNWIKNKDFNIINNFIGVKCNL
jgi:hypothetical protein